MIVYYFGLKIPLEVSVPDDRRKRLNIFTTKQLSAMEKHVKYTYSLLARTHTASVHPQFALVSHDNRRYTSTEVAS